jgi:radical SAM superfamily enzyme YgiQ (UPF0313 family)
VARVVFLQNIWHEQLGIESLSAHLKASGHECELLIEGAVRDLPARLKQHRPDLVALSVTTGLHPWAFEMAARVKHVLRVPVIMGGPHPTFYPETIQDPNIDVICRGEGEEPLRELVECLDTGRDYGSIANLWVKRDGQIIRNEVRPLCLDLDALPFPDRDLCDRYWFFRYDAVKHVCTSRGCPFSCTYCFNQDLKEIYRGKGRYVRQRSVDNTIAELVELKATRRPRALFFIDDILLMNPRWTREFLARYREEVHLPFICNASPDYLEDEEVVVGLKEAGCVNIRFGIESGNEEIRRTVLKRRTPNETIINVGSLLKKHRIRFLTYNMVGFPRETVDQAFETMEINARIRTDYPRISVFQPYPGTELGDRALREGLIRDEDKDRIGQTYFKDSVIRQENIGQIVNLHKLFLLVIRFPWLKPLVRHLIKVPPNPLYEGIFLISMALQHAGATHRGFLRSVVVGVYNLGFFLRGARSGSASLTPHASRRPPEGA